MLLDVPFLAEKSFVFSEELLCHCVLDQVAVVGLMIPV